MAARALNPIDQYERRLRAEGFNLIAGVDEAGPGALARALGGAAGIPPPDLYMGGVGGPTQPPRFGPSPIHRMSFKGMDLYLEDPDTYRELYGREDLAVEENAR